MAKGFFTQGVTLLTDGATTIVDIRAALQQHGFEIVKEVPPQPFWAFGGPALAVPFLPEVNGYASVDVINHHWPDSMGDPKTDPMTFGAWSMGYFGPFAFPGGLERASQHPSLWKLGTNISSAHHGFVRIRLSYVLGAGEDAAILPKHYDPLAELNFCNRIILAMFDVPGVICYFNPNGEVLCDHTEFRRVWSACREQKKIPLPLWANIRSFKLSDQFAFIDTVGNGQLDIHDVEAIYPRQQFSLQGVVYYLGNVTHYLLELQREIRSGEAIDGPGESNASWTIDIPKNPAASPNRQVLRLFPTAHMSEIGAQMANLGK